MDLRDELEREMAQYLQQPEVALPWLVPGRLVRIVEERGGDDHTSRIELDAYEGKGEGVSKDGQKGSGSGHSSRGIRSCGLGKRGGVVVEWGWGVVVGFKRRGLGQADDAEEGEVKEGGEEEETLDASDPNAWIVYVLLATIQDQGCAGFGFWVSDFVGFRIQGFAQGWFLKIVAEQGMLARIRRV